MIYSYVVLHVIIYREVVVVLTIFFTYNTSNFYSCAHRNPRLQMTEGVWHGRKESIIVGSLHSLVPLAEH
jgi:hypothetical protein